MMPVTVRTARRRSDADRWVAGAAAQVVTDAPIGAPLPVDARADSAIPTARMPTARAPPSARAASVSGVMLVDDDGAGAAPGDTLSPRSGRHAATARRSPGAGGAMFVDALDEAAAVGAGVDAGTFSAPSRTGRGPTVGDAVGGGWISQRGGAAGAAPETVVVGSQTQRARGGVRMSGLLPPAASTTARRADSAGRGAGAPVVVVDLPGRISGSSGNVPQDPAK
jgi:hypothetical protein